MEKSQVYDLINSMRIRQGEVISENLVKTDYLDVSLFGFAADEGVSYETLGVQKLYMPLEGKMQMTIENADKSESSYLVDAFDFTLIDKGVMRDVSGIDNYKILMITLKEEKSMLKNIDKQKLLNLSEEIGYQENKIASKTLASDKLLNMTLLAFDGVQELSTHTAPGDALVIALDGQARINIDGEDFQIKKGESIIMPVNIPHGVYVTDKFKMLLIVSK